MQPIHQLPKMMPNKKILSQLDATTKNWRIILTSALLGKSHQLPTKTWTPVSLSKTSKAPQINTKLEAEYRAQRKLTKQNSKPIIPF